MDYAAMDRSALRAACREHGISYGKLTVPEMRAALEAVQPEVQPEVPQDDTPVVQEQQVAPQPEVPREPAAAPVVQKGLKIQKDRIERNGIKQPSAGGLCRAVWDWCSAQADAPTAKQLKEAATQHGWNANNASIEFYRWRKWAAPTAEELAAVQPAPEAAPAHEGVAA